jgi:flagellar basal-body rod protein FlgB
VNEISDSALIESLRRQMTMSVARQVAAAGNLANVSTPGYRAVEPSFAEALEGQLGMTGSLPGHVGPLGGAEAEMREVKGATARRDGNTVELDRELLTMTRAGGDFSAAQTALAAKFRLVRYAINEGR